MIEHRDRRPAGTVPLYRVRPLIASHRRYRPLGFDVNGRMRSSFDEDLFIELISNNTDRVS
jgi:hypothetical protein